MNTPHGITVSDYILKKCPWFYEFEGVFHDHPGVNPPIAIESGQPPRRDGVAMKETDLGGFGGNDDVEAEADEGPSKDQEEGAISTHEDEDKEAKEASDTESQHSAHSLAAAAQKKAAEATLLLPSLNEDWSWLDDVPKTKTQPQIPQTPVPNRAKAVPAETMEQTSAKPTKPADQPPKEKAKKTTSKARSKSKRPVPEDSDSESNDKSRRNLWKSSKGRLTMAEFMLEQSHIEDARAKIDKEERRELFEFERQQREHHHAAQMANSQILINKSEERVNESKERLLRLEMEVAERQQRLRGYEAQSEYDMGSSHGLRSM